MAINIKPKERNLESYAFYTTELGGLFLLKEDCSTASLEKFLKGICIIGVITPDHDFEAGKECTAFARRFIPFEGTIEVS